MQAAALVRAQRDEAEGPFTLLTPLPRREFATEAQLQATFREAQLVPRGTLLVLSERNRGRVERGASGPAAQQAQLQDHLAHLQSMIAEMQKRSSGGEETAQNLAATKIAAMQRGKAARAAQKAPVEVQ